VLAVAAATAAFGSAAAPREGVPAWLALFAASAVGLALAGAALVRARPRRWAAWVLGGALLLRLAALAAPVSLSEDVHRYVWDGTLLASGHDPFAARPREVVGLPGLGADRLAQLNSPDYYSVYPPLAQLAFALGGVARLAGLDGELLLRAAFVGFDLLAIALLIGLSRRLGRPRWWALLYAWNPLVVWEVAGSGHTEALMVPPLLLALGAALDARPARAGLWLGLAASAKLSALVLAPVLLVHLARRVGPARAARFAGAAAAVLALGFVPFMSPHLWPHVRESLALYQEVFSFNAPVYYAARHLLGYEEGVTPPVDAALMPWLTAATLAWIGAVALHQTGERRRLVAGLAWAYVGYLLLSRVVHPWYLLPPLALGVLANGRALVLLSLLVPLSYLRYHPLGREAPWVIALQVVPFALLALLDAARERRARRARRLARAALGSPSRPRPLEAIARRWRPLPTRARPRRGRPPP
jgi:hypothetical protein